MRVACSRLSACSSVAAVLALSSVLYDNNVPADQISWALAGCAAVNYLIFDGTKQGLALALLCALACPAAEVGMQRFMFKALPLECGAAHVGSAGASLRSPSQPLVPADMRRPSPAAPAPCS